MIGWLNAAFWTVLIGGFVVSLVLSLLAMAVSIVCSCVTIAVNAPAALRHWRRGRG